MIVQVRRHADVTEWNASDYKVRMIRRTVECDKRRVERVRLKLR
jgi:hypothetical protein